jgi:hypothetical protein
VRRAIFVSESVVQTEARDRVCPAFVAILRFLGTNWPKAAALLAALVCAVLSPPSVSAASLERLPDGRIVLTALGEKFAFRERDAEQVDLHWPEYPCKPKPRRVSLALWRDDPVVAACLNKAIPDDFPPGSLQSLTLRVQLAFENGEPYPGQGKRIDEPIGTDSLLYPGPIKATDLPTPPRLFGFVFVSVLHVNKGFNANVPADGSPDGLGYQAHRIGKAPPFYRLPADRRPGNMMKPLDVACSDAKPSHCSISLRSADGYVGLGLDWLGPSPRADWTLYDAAARKIADWIFIARKSEDVQ